MPATFTTTSRDAIAMEALAAASRIGGDALMMRINAYGCADTFLRLPGADVMADEDRAVVIGGIVAEAIGF